MKTSNKIGKESEDNSDHKQETVEAIEFHAMRIQREMTIETQKESAQKPQGTDEYEQLIAENASFNAKPMIEEAAFVIAEKRGFTPENEVSDWLQAEDDVESLLRGATIERRTAIKDRRKEAAIPGRDK